MANRKVIFISEIWDFGKISGCNFSNSHNEKRVLKMPTPGFLKFLKNGFSKSWMLGQVWAGLSRPRSGRNGRSGSLAISAMSLLARI